MNYKDDLLEQALKHKGTDVAGWLQSAHTVIENQEGHIAELETQNQNLHEAYSRILAGLQELKATLYDAHNQAIKALPIDQFATVKKDATSHVNIMNFHGVDGYGKKGRPTTHKDVKLKTVIL